ncbi:MAG: DUF5620 domain-containing protein [Ruminococcus sp.]|nr:DUF5620 domain-containing protein [Ruminococcus sp.]
MKKNGLTRRMQAAVMSAVITASAVPAYMMSTASAVFAPSLSISQNKTASQEWDDKSSIKVDIPSTYSESNPLKTIVVNIDSEYGGSFSYGIGITTDKGWMEHTKDDKWTTNSKEGSGYSVDLKKGSNKIAIDVSSLNLQYGEYGNFEFRCYYSAHWDNSISDMVANTVTFNGFTYNDNTAIDNPDNPDNPNKPNNPPDKPDDKKENIIPDNNKHTNGTNSEDGKNWSFKDNGDGTATISATVAKQIDGDALGKIVLTKGYDEDYYASNPSEATDKPINSHKFRFSDFGITDMVGVTIESLTCTIESDVEMDQFVYGGGINVKQGSPADTEYAKQLAGIKGKESASYWYNDMGLEGDGSVSSFEEAGVKFEITPGNGGKLFGAGSYIEAYWEVPAEVQPHVSDSTTDTLSFQYWWGNDVDGEEVESVNLTNAVLTYTKTVTVPYTDSVSNAVAKTITHTGTDSQKNLEIEYTDLGVDETKDVYAIRFDVSAKSDIGKLIYNVGTGVDESVNSEYWFQESGNYAILDAGDTAQIMWIVPANVAGDEVHPNGINTKDGKLLIGYYYGETDSITVDNIEIYYADAPTTTTTTTITTTSTTKATTTTTTATTTTTTSTIQTTTTEPVTTTTTTEPALTVSLWGDANCDGKVTIADATAIIQALGNEDEYKLSAQGALNADVIDNGDGVTGTDANAIQAIEAGFINQTDFPMSKADLDAAMSK